MIEITEQQERDLYKLVRQGGIAAVGGIEQDGEQRAAVDFIFAQRLQLVEYGLAVIAKGRLYKKETERMHKIEGRDVILLNPSKIGAAMFRRKETCQN